MIYFDNSATTFIDESVLKTYNQVTQMFPGNPSSLHRLGRSANSVLQSSRDQLKSELNLKDHEIIFTSGATEANNMIIKGISMARIKQGKHMIISSIEHDSVLKPVEQLIKLGFSVTYLNPDRNGRIDPEELKAAISNDTSLVSLMAINNEVGSIQPINECAEILNDHPQIVFHVDAVQAVGKNLDLYSNPRIDFATFSAHKFNGPRGVGFLTFNNKRPFSPLLAGGGQEYNKRSGTENTPAIAAMAKAFRLSLENSIENELKYNKMRKLLIDFLRDNEEFSLISTSSSYFTPSIISFSIRGLRGETIVHYLEDKDIYISTTSACSSRDSKPSHVLKAMNLPEDIITGAVRVSLGSKNQVSEMEDFISVLKKMKDEIKVLI